MVNIREFDNWERAFDYVRLTLGCKPATVKIIPPADEPGTYVVFPSGCVRRFGEKYSKRRKRAPK